MPSWRRCDKLEGRRARDCSEARAAEIVPYLGHRDVARAQREPSSASVSRRAGNDSRQIFLSKRQLFERLVRSARQTLVVLEDAHWVDNRRSRCCETCSRWRRGAVVFGSERAPSLAKPAARPGPQRCASRRALSRRSRLALLAPGTRTLIDQPGRRGRSARAARAQIQRRTERGISSFHSRKVIRAFIADRHAVERTKAAQAGRLARPMSACRYPTPCKRDRLRRIDRSTTTLKERAKLASVIGRSSIFLRVLQAVSRRGDRHRAEPGPAEETEADP
jgi:hypothetical protein